MLLTRHAEKRLIKRLTKRRESKRVYSKLWEFLDRSVRIRVNDEVVIFTDGRKSLVSVKLDCKMLSLGEIKSRVDWIKQPCKCVFSDGRLVKETIPLKFLKLVPDGVYCFYINREKRSFYVGSKPPLLAITLRPAKKSERENYALSSIGTTRISPKGSSWMSSTFPMFERKSR